MSSHDQGIERIGRLGRQAERRIRLGRALEVGARALCVALVVAVVDVSLRKVGVLGNGTARGVLALSGAAAVIATIVGWARRLPARAGAHALDRFHHLSDRFASALSFAEHPAPSRTPFMAAAIADAITMLPVARPRAAVPIRVPPHLGAAGGLAVLLVGVTLFEVRTHVPLAMQRPIEPVEMSADDLDDVHDFLKQLDQSSVSDDTKAAIDQFNKLIDDIANKRLDRTEAFRRMEALEEKLLTGSIADKKVLEEQLDRIGEELKKAELTKPAGEALSDHRLDRARDAMHELAKKLRSAPEKPVDKAKLDQLRESLKKAAADAEQRRRELEQRRQELADEILKMKQRAPDGASDEERSLLEKKQRELDRLDRDLDAHSEASRSLERLDRELDQAAEDLMKDLGLSAQDLERSAEDINRMDQQEMTQQEKEQLRQRLQELRELMREQGQGGKDQMARLKRFGRMARGRTGSAGQGGQKGGQGSGQDEEQSGDGQMPQGGEPGEEGKDQGGSQGSNGGGATWVLGPNGEKMLLLSKGQGQGQGDPSSGGGGQKGEGRQWGEGHDSQMQGAATNPKMGTQDTQVQGADTAQGGSRSQVILGAAERGFASRGYKRVYTEYHQVAEESLTKDEIPGGYRFYVKRYFQLIRPREEP